MGRVGADLEIEDFQVERTGLEEEPEGYEVLGATPEQELETSEETE